jgi:hypothetical protein
MPGQRACNRRFGFSFRFSGSNQISPVGDQADQPAFFVRSFWGDFLSVL